MVEFNSCLFDFDAKSKKFERFDCFCKFKNEWKSVDLKKSEELWFEFDGFVKNALTFNCSSTINRRTITMIKYDDIFT